MSEAARAPTIPAAELPADVRDRTLARFEAHRRAWDGNEALRTLYARWYGQVRQALPDRTLGPWIELGSGPGFARHFIPEIELTDVVQAPWHDRRVSAEALPYADASLGAIVLFDVLHHLPSPARFFDEATRALAPGGRLIVCEPYVGPLSYPVYKFLHDEPLHLLVDPLAERTATDPFDANQAIPTILFGRARERLSTRVPGLRLTQLRHLAGPAYPASGGFSHRSLLPMQLWRALLAVEDRLPSSLFRLLGFRLFAVLERT